MEDVRSPLKGAKPSSRRVGSRFLVRLRAQTRRGAQIDPVAPRRAPGLDEPHRHRPIFCALATGASLAIFFLLELPMEGGVLPLTCPTLDATGLPAYADGSRCESNMMLGVSVSLLDRLGAKNDIAIFERGEWWRLLSCTWLHTGVFHLLVNLVSTLCLGIGVERAFGWRRTAALYLFSGLSGAFASAALLPGVISVGGSASVFGLVGAYWADVLLNYVAARCTLRDAGVPHLVLATLPSLLVGVTPWIDNLMHIGGAVGGGALACLLLPRLNVEAAERGHGISASSRHRDGPRDAIAGRAPPLPSLPPPRVSPLSAASPLRRQPRAGAAWRELYTADGGAMDREVAAASTSIIASDGGLAARSKDGPRRRPSQGCAAAVQPQAQWPGATAGPSASGVEMTAQGCRASEAPPLKPLRPPPPVEVPDGDTMDSTFRDAPPHGGSGAVAASTTAAAAAARTRRADAIRRWWAWAGYANLNNAQLALVGGAALLILLGTGLALGAVVHDGVHSLLRSCGACGALSCVEVSAFSPDGQPWWSCCVAALPGSCTLEQHGVSTIVGVCNLTGAGQAFTRSCDTLAEPDRCRWDAGDPASTSALCRQLCFDC